MKLNRIELETEINYNQEEKTAVCHTYDKALMRRLDKLMENENSIKLLREGDGWKEYSFPKKYIKIRCPRHLSDEARKKNAERLRIAREARKINDNK